MKIKLTGIRDINGNDIPYNVPINFTWWSCAGTVDTQLKCKIRHRKTGDIFDFYEEGFTHRLTAIYWEPEDLELLEGGTL